MISEILNNSRYFYWFAAIYFLSLIVVGLIAEHFFKIAPCSLCYYQRYIMIAIIIAAFAVVISKVDHKAFTTLIILTALGGTILSGFHIGVEQKWWAMPQSCISKIEITSTDPSEMLKSLQSQMINQKMPRCDKINWYVFGVPASWLTFLAFLFSTIIMGWREWNFPKK